MSAITPSTGEVSQMSYAPSRALLSKVPKVSVDDPSLKLGGTEDIRPLNVSTKSSKAVHPDFVLEFKRHEGRHLGFKDFICLGPLKHGAIWGCGRSFDQVSVFAQHLKTETACIVPLLEEHADEVRQPQAVAISLHGYCLPDSLLQRYPDLTEVDWNAFRDLPPAKVTKHSSPSLFYGTDDVSPCDDLVESGMGTGPLSWLTEVNNSPTSTNMNKKHMSAARQRYLSQDLPGDSSSPSARHNSIMESEHGSRAPLIASEHNDPALRLGTHMNPNDLNAFHQHPDDAGGSYESIEMPSAHCIVPSIYGQARNALTLLRLCIEELSDGPETASENSESGPETPCLTRHCSRIGDGRRSPESANDNQEDTGDGGEDVREAQTHPDKQLPQATGSRLPSDWTNGKRPRLEDGSDGSTQAEVGLSGKRRKVACKRFICCFHNGPGRKCSGTDETISEAIKKLSEQHDTHLCDRCWVLKVKDESSGLPIHPGDGSQCLDHCLSPQCHATTPSIGYRHVFNPDICKTKTSRVRPKDSEAVFRFIFQLVQPAVELPVEVTTAKYGLHLDARPRQGRRKVTREELSLRADELGRLLEEGNEQNVALKARVTKLEQALNDSHSAVEREEKRSSSLEKQIRRIIAMLRDALRTGTFPDYFGHQSLLARVREDAPDALRSQSQSILTPRSSAASQLRGASSASAAFSWMPDIELPDQEQQNFFDVNVDTSNVGPPGTQLAPGDPYIFDYGSGDHLQDPESQNT